MGDAGSILKHRPCSSRWPPYVRAAIVKGATVMVGVEVSMYIMPSYSWD